MGIVTKYILYPMKLEKSTCELVFIIPFPLGLNFIIFFYSLPLLIRKRQMASVTIIVSGTGSTSHLFCWIGIQCRQCAMDII